LYVFFRSTFAISPRYSALGIRWNAAKVLATYLDNNKELYVDKSVLELGAGGALPSIVAALNGAKHVRCIFPSFDFSYEVC